MVAEYWKLLTNRWWGIVALAFFFWSLVCSLWATGELNSTATAYDIPPVPVMATVGWISFGSAVFLALLGIYWPLIWPKRRKIRRIHVVRIPR